MIKSMSAHVMNTKNILTGSLLLLLTACGNGGIVSSRHNEVSVTSNPSAASVYVMGELQGVTPMSINLTQLYPATYSKEFSHLYGYIVLKQDGCKNKTVKITPDIADSGLNEELNCTSIKKTDVNETDIEASSVKDKSIKLRLKELLMLKEEGLINDGEYNKVRRRILESI